jgi:hypothetical protein
MNSSAALFKRQLWTYNLTVHNCSSGDLMFYMWYKGDGGRGENQIATCLFKELTSIPCHVTHALFCDTCGDQNKNSHVSVMFLAVMQTMPLG